MTTGTRIGGYIAARWWRVAGLEYAEAGPGLGRPMVDRIHGSRLHKLKELRPGSAGRSEIRLLFVFDVEREAVILVAGDKAGQWNRWYRENIPVAEDRYEELPGRAKE